MTASELVHAESHQPYKSSLIGQLPAATAHAMPFAAAAPSRRRQAAGVTASSHSSAQVLGRQLVQYAKHIGIRTINVVRRDEHIEELKALG